MPHDAHATTRCVRFEGALPFEASSRGWDFVVDRRRRRPGRVHAAWRSRASSLLARRPIHARGRALMEAAGSGLLCTEEVADRVRRAVSLSPERPLALKGLRWPAATIPSPRIRPYRRAARRAVRAGRRAGRARSVPESTSRTDAGRCCGWWAMQDSGKSALVHYLRQCSGAPADQVHACRCRLRRDGCAVRRLARGLRPAARGSATGRIVAPRRNGWRDSGTSGIRSSLR